MRLHPTALSRRRICVAGAMASVSLLLPRTGSPQSASKMARVGVLFSDQSEDDKPEWIAFISEMSRRGWVEGRNVIFEKRFGETDRPERIDALAFELAALNVDVLYVGSGTRGALAAKRATNTVPVVFRSSADPVRFGLVENLRYPGGNLTGQRHRAHGVDAGL